MCLSIAVFYLVMYCTNRTAIQFLRIADFGYLTSCHAIGIPCGYSHLAGTAAVQIDGYLTT